MLFFWRSWSPRPGCGRSRRAATQSQNQQPEIVIVIGGDGNSPPHYAVPDFVAASPDAGRGGPTISQVLWDDLAFEREFYLIPRDIYTTVPAARSPEQVPFASWRELGADAVFFGTVQTSGDKVTVQVRLFNVRTRQPVFSQGIQRHGVQSASLRPHDRRRGAPAAARAPRRRAHQADVRLGSQPRASAAVRSTTARSRRSTSPTTTARTSGASRPRGSSTSHPSWSPDARAVAYTSYRGTDAADLPVAASIRACSRTRPRTPAATCMPVFSPDGTKIAFMSNRDGNPEIYVMNRDGSNVRRLTNHPAVRRAPRRGRPTARRSPSPRTAPAQPQIYIMNAADGVERAAVDGERELRRSRRPGRRRRSTRSPTPRRPGQWFDIKVHDLATGTVRQITFGEGSNESPAYSPNGKHLAFTSTRAGGTQVFTIGRDGRGLKQITRERQQPRRPPGRSSLLESRSNRNGAVDGLGIALAHHLSRGRARVFAPQTSPLPPPQPAPTVEAPPAVTPPPPPPRAAAAAGRGSAAPARAVRGFGGQPLARRAQSRLPAPAGVLRARQLRPRRCRTRGRQRRTSTS